MMIRRTSLVDTNLFSSHLCYVLYFLGYSNILLSCWVCKMINFLNLDVYMGFYIYSICLFGFEQIYYLHICCDCVGKSGTDQV